ncbi:MAG: SMC-Scp complex subunit ScpB [Pseudomonadota bacterium]|nr:SMC-Scp complex subunit ScpB [Pseudomonadota bacterium]
MSADPEQRTPGLAAVLEALLLAADAPLSLDQMQQVFDLDERPDKAELRAALGSLESACSDRTYQLVEVGSGYQYRIRGAYARWVSRLWEDKPARYSRALLETLALIAYRQPITRGEIEAVRGVAVSSQIIRTLSERDWVRIVGHREVPGRPALYATTRGFLDHFNLKSLDELPALAELTDLDKVHAEFDFDPPNPAAQAAGPSVSDPDHNGSEDGRSTH